MVKRVGKVGRLAWWTWGAGGAAALGLLWLGGGAQEWPVAGVKLQERIELYPDYTGLVIPPNIAPLVCEIKNRGQGFQYRLASFDGKITYQRSGRTISPPLGLWRRMAEASQGEHVTLEVRVERKGGLGELISVTNQVAREPIDSALVYRLIPPSYEQYQKLSLCQRDLTSFDERVLYSNVQVSREQCINCHTFRNQDGRYFAFHARNKHAGTVIFRDGKPGWKVDLKSKELYSSGVYAAWHPTKENLFAFSVNQTAQLFYLTGHGKIEVLDSQSGLVLYDLEKNEVTPIELEEQRFATYPEWAPDGKRLYYTVAEMKELAPGGSEAERLKRMTGQLTNLCYGLACRSFDPETRRFGAPRLLINAAESHASIAFPRVSPDGTYVMMTVLAYGNFPVWHPESDLWIYNTRTREARPLGEVNSAEADSYHAWGSNGRWFVFGSRRDDGIHTRPYLAYFDPVTGRAGKAFVVPQKRPEFYRQFFYSFNRPELLKVPVPSSAEEIREVMMQPEQKGGVWRKAGTARHYRRKGDKKEKLKA